MKTLAILIGAFIAGTIIDNLTGASLTIAAGLAAAFTAITIAAIKQGSTK